MTRPTSSRTLKVIELYQQGLSNQEIAEAVDSASAGSVATTISRFYSGGRGGPQAEKYTKRQRTKSLRVFVTDATVVAFREAALDRGLSRRELTERLLAAIARKDLFSSLLEETNATV